LHLELPKQSQVNKIDRGIITELWRNASETNENIAARLEVSESTVRKRGRWLKENGLVHITAMRNLTLGSDVMFAFIGLNLSSPDIHGISEKLRRLRQVHIVAHVLGRYDIIAQVLVSDDRELSSLVNDVIASIAGVRDIHCARPMKIVKYDHRWRLGGCSDALGLGNFPE
jgi:Lrp/AsnC family transcriptional regulator for asnA, asnC and gidA